MRLMRAPMRVSMRAQTGSVLLEALIAVGIFSFGILSIAALQARSVQLSSDARYRAEASFLADSLIGQIRADTPNMGCYAVNDPNKPSCGSATAASMSKDWLNRVTGLLPGATSANQEVKVDQISGEVTVTLRWQAPGQDAHNYMTATRVQ